MHYLETPHIARNCPKLSCISNALMSNVTHIIISQIQTISPKDLNKSVSVSTFQNQEVEKSRFP